MSCRTSNTVLRCIEGSRMPGELYRVMMVVGVRLSPSRSRGARVMDCVQETPGSGFQVIPLPKSYSVSRKVGIPVWGFQSSSSFSQILLDRVPEKNNVALQIELCLGKITLGRKL